MNKIITIILVLTMAFIFAACSKETEELVIHDTGMEMTTNNFSSTETQAVSLTAGSDILLNINTHSGSIDILITDTLGNIIGSGTEVNGSMSFGIREDGEYIIYITGKSHCGSFKVSW